MGYSLLAVGTFFKDSSCAFSTSPSPNSVAELGGEKLEEGIMRSDAKSLLVNCPAEQLAFILPNKRMSKKGAKQFMCKLLGCNAISKGFCFWVPMGYLRSVAAVVRCRG